MSSSTNDTVSETPDGRLVVGHIARAHGIRGDVVAKFYSDDPHRFGPGDELMTDPGGESLLIVRARPMKGGHLVTFEGSEDRNRAEALRGQRLTIPANARRTLADDEYWPEDLAGLEVRNEGGIAIGKVVKVVLGDAQDRLLVESLDGTQADVPFVDEFVPTLAIADGYLVVIEIPGLFD